MPIEQGAQESGMATVAKLAAEGLVTQSLQYDYYLSINFVVQSLSCV